MRRNTQAVRKFFATALAVFAALFVIAKCTGCAAAAPALDVAGHSLALAKCREVGKDAGSYAVYSMCADDADRRYMDGGAK